MKISALTAATTPLSGAELFPIVQSGNTRRVSLDDLLRSIGNGTAAAPALAPGGDPNTGIYFPAADTIGFVEGGVESMRIDANGRVGIGTTSPGQRLHVASAGSNYIVSHNTSGSTAALLLGAENGNTAIYSWSTVTGSTGRPLLFYTGAAEAMRLDVSGNLGLGVTPNAWANSGNVQLPSGRGIAFGGNAYFYANAFSGSGGNTYIATAAAAQYAMESGSHRWFTAPSGTANAAIAFTQAMTLDASGRLLIDTTTGGVANSSSTKLTVGGAAATNYASVKSSGGEELLFGATAGGTFFGAFSNHALELRTNNTERWRISSSGHLLAGTDATYDIGASGATRPRDLFLGRNLTLDGLLTASSLQIGTVSANLSNVSNGLVAYANGHPSYPNGTVIIQSRSTLAQPIVFVTGATTGTARMSVKGEGQVRFVPLAAAPTTSVEDGDVYYDSGTNKLRVRAGGAWTDLH